jgi:hypothetical protein
MGNNGIIGEVFSIFLTWFPLALSAAWMAELACAAFYQICCIHFVHMFCV